MLFISITLKTGCWLNFFWFNHFRWRYPLVNNPGVFMCFRVILLLLLSSSALCQEIYKYKDEKGKWIFTDKRPLNLNDNEFESVEYKRKRRKFDKPRVYRQRTEGKNVIIADNPYHAPVEFLLLSPQLVGGSQKHVVPAASQKGLYTSSEDIVSFRYRWCLGDPSVSEDNYVYTFPVSSQFSHKITQAFHGKFSHSRPSSRYAVDVAVTVGTNISAARGGVVIWVRDDYHMSGKNKYFLDKANYVKVLHEDGTYATYAHILTGTVRVKPGDVVEVGDVLARSGSSGYSTGPHLHFVIRKNREFKTVAVPFKFITNDGKAYTPEAGMMIDALKKR